MSEANVVIPAGMTAEELKAKLTAVVEKLKAVPADSKVADVLTKDEFRTLKYAVGGAAIGGAGTAALAYTGVLAGWQLAAAGVGLVGGGFFLGGLVAGLTDGSKK